MLFVPSHCAQRVCVCVALFLQWFLLVCVLMDKAETFFVCATISSWACRCMPLLHGANLHWRPHLCCFVVLSSHESSSLQTILMYHAKHACVCVQDSNLAGFRLQVKEGASLGTLRFALSNGPSMHASSGYYNVDAFMPWASWCKRQLRREPDQCMLLHYWYHYHHAAASATWVRMHVYHLVMFIYHAVHVQRTPTSLQTLPRRESSMASDHRYEPLLCTIAKCT
jgi:hypothetical protein